MSKENNIRLANRLLTDIAQGADPGQIAELFSEDVDVEIAGDVGALPWIGRKSGRSAVAAFIRDQRDLIEPVRFDVEGILADDHRAVIIGQLASRIKQTGKVIETAFALILTTTDARIIRFQMLEDSFAASRAARAEQAEVRSD